MIPEQGPRGKGVGTPEQGLVALGILVTWDRCQPESRHVDTQAFSAGQPAG